MRPRQRTKGNSIPSPSTSALYMIWGQLTSSVSKAFVFPYYKRLRALHRLVQFNKTGAHRGPDLCILNTGAVISKPRSHSIPGPSMN